MEISNLVPIGAAIVGAFALLLAGDLLTIKARLRRKLDKELAIADKLPAGLARRNMNSLVRKHALALYHREQYESAVPLVIGGQSALGLALAAGTWIYLAKHPEIAVNPSAIYQVVGFTVACACFLVTMLIFMVVASVDRAKFVAKHSKESAPRPLGRARQLRHPTPRAEVGRRSRRSSIRTEGAS